MGRTEKSSSSSSRPRKRSPDDDADPDDEDSKRAEAIQNGLNEAVQNKEGGSSRKRSPDDADLEGADTEDDDQEDDDTEDDEAVPNAFAESIERMSKSDAMQCNACRAEAEALEANTTKMDNLKRKLKEMKPRLRELERLTRIEVNKRRKIYAQTICGNPGNLSVGLRTDMDTTSVVLACAMGINAQEYRQNLKNLSITKALQQRRKKDLKELRSQKTVLTRQLLDTLGRLYDCDNELLELLPEPLQPVDSE